MAIDCVCIGLVFHSLFAVRRSSFAIPYDYVFSNVDECQDERLTANALWWRYGVMRTNQNEHETRRIFCFANLNKLRKSYLSKKYCSKLECFSCRSSWKRNGTNSNISFGSFELDSFGHFLNSFISFVLHERRGQSSIGSSSVPAQHRQQPTSTRFRFMHFRLTQFPFETNSQLRKWRKKHKKKYCKL